MPTATTTTTTVLKARLKSDGSFAYELPKREHDKLLKAQLLCEQLANIPAIEQQAVGAAKALNELAKRLFKEDA